MPRKLLHKPIEVGGRYGGYTVLEFVCTEMWECKCDCGKEQTVKTGNLRINLSGCRACVKHLGNPGKSPLNCIDLTGRRVGRLRVLARSDNRYKWMTYWLCRCDCGREKVICGNSLRAGTTKSCGCLRSQYMSEKKMTHGQTSKFVEHSGLISPCMGIALEYVIWNSAKARSRKYGLEFNIEPSDITIPETCPLLGITLVQGDKKVCDSSPSLDRINPKRGYVKGNIRVISFRANTIKAGRTEDELQQELLACLSAMQPMGATYAMHGIQEIF